MKKVVLMQDNLPDNDHIPTSSSSSSHDYDPLKIAHTTTLAGPKRKKVVHFVEGTAGPKEAVLAVTISRFDNLENLGYTEYTIQLYSNGSLWSIQRRYKHFEKLANDLKKENLSLKQPLPVLPKKRWLQVKRWLSRFDDSYCYDRQVSLQEYLKALIKNPVIRNESKSLRKFLDIDENTDLSEVDYEPFRDRNVVYYEGGEEVCFFDDCDDSSSDFHSSQSTVPSFDMHGESSFDSSHYDDFHRITESMKYAAVTDRDGRDVQPRAGGVLDRKSGPEICWKVSEHDDADTDEFDGRSLVAERPVDRGSDRDLQSMLASVAAALDDQV